MKLKTLIENIDCKILGDPDIEISGISNDSRSIKEGEIFVAVKGEIFDGHDFLKEAVKKGAKAVTVEKEMRLNLSLPTVITDNTRKTTALMARNFYRDPSSELILFGITGTNGKTSVAHILKAVLEKSGMPTGLIGTTGHQIGTSLIKDRLTTPDSILINRLLRDMIEYGCKAAVMEVSSHSLALHRVHGLKFNTAIFTNLSRDHLDFHLTIEDYMKSKSLLFQNMDSNAKAVFNADDPSSPSILKDTRAALISYSMEEGKGDYSMIAYDCTVKKTDMEIKTPHGRLSISSPLKGKFNLYNILAVVSAAASEGIQLKAIKEAIAEIPQIPGRFEFLPLQLPFYVIIDYAHTPGALKNVLLAALDLKKDPRNEIERIVCVFGCGGDRDKGKRGIMGKIASSLADLCVITTDNPRFEDPEAIINQILRGVEKEKKPMVITDRKEAITRTIHKAKEGDLILICGKGHEDYQEIKGRRIPFSDKEIVKSCFNNVALKDQ